MPAALLSEVRTASALQVLSGGDLPELPVHGVRRHAAAERDDPEPRRVVQAACDEPVLRYVLRVGYVPGAAAPLHPGEYPLFYFHLFPCRLHHRCAPILIKTGQDWLSK